MSPPAASVVIPTHNRPEGLVRCLEAIVDGGLPPAVELVVVDDGSNPPLEADGVRWPGPLTVIRLDGLGPSGARNAGALRATGDVLLFTDDDTIPGPNWISTALDHLIACPADLGVEGVVISPPWDPLYEFSIHAEHPGHYWTCNIAYRREAFLELGGFRADLFPAAHAEDRDLALRALSRGSIGFAAGMRIVHTPRDMTPADFRRRATWVRSDLVLDALTRTERHRSGLLGEPRLYSMIWTARRWLRMARSPEADVLRSPRRLLRYLRIALPAVAAGWWAAARAPSEARLRRELEPLRVARPLVPCE